MYVVISQNNLHAVLSANMSNVSFKLFSSTGVLDNLKYHFLIKCYVISAACKHQQ